MSKSDYLKQRYRTLKISGRCVTCNAEKEAKKSSRCIACSERHAEQQRRYRSDAEIRAALRLQAEVA